MTSRQRLNVIRTLIVEAKGLMHGTASDRALAEAKLHAALRFIDGKTNVVRST